MLASEQEPRVAPEKTGSSKRPVQCNTPLAAPAMGYGRGLMPSVLRSSFSSTPGALADSRYCPVSGVKSRSPAPPGPQVQQLAHWPTAGTPLSPVSSPNPLHHQSGASANGVLANSQYCSVSGAKARSPAPPAQLQPTILVCLYTGKQAQGGSSVERQLFCCTFPASPPRKTR